LGSLALALASSNSSFVLDFMLNEFTETQLNISSKPPKPPSGGLGLVNCALRAPAAPSTADSLTLLRFSPRRNDSLRVAAVALAESASSDSAITASVVSTLTATAPVGQEGTQSALKAMPVTVDDPSLALAFAFETSHTTGTPLYVGDHSSNTDFGHTTCFFAEHFCVTAFCDTTRCLGGKPIPARVA
jgi:hypothetical protein